MSVVAVNNPLFSLPNAISSSEITPLPSSSSPPTIKTPTLEQTKLLHARFLRAGFSHHFLPHFFAPSAHLNPLISSYNQNNCPHTAFKLYAHARKTLAAALDSFTVPTVLKSCALFGSLRHGAEVHGFSIKVGLDCDAFVNNSLIRMYSDCEELYSATSMFDEMPHRDVVSWSTMIKSYGRSGLYQESIGLMIEMLSAGVNPTEVAVINMINVLADASELEMGRQVHAVLMKKSEFIPPGVNISTALIDMYAKCGCREMARSVFDRADDRSTASWTAMIDGYARSGDLQIAVELFGRMADDNVRPNEITVLSLISSCGLYKKIWLGRWLHAYILRHGLEMQVTLATALLDLYCRCGDNKSARALFDGMREDTSSWNVMISGYSQQNRFNEAFELFNQMKDLEMKPNGIAMASLLSLCADAGALDRGRSLHAFIQQRGIKMDVVLATALVDMYAKCGEMEKASILFNGTDDKDVCMWNAMLNGLAMNGCGEEAIRVFSDMNEAGIRPNGVSFVGILKACSHTGLVAEGKQFFRGMELEYGLVPRVEHYGCLVDLLGRAGLLHEAHDTIRRMPVAPNVVVWGALMAACKMHKNLNLGELVAKEILKLDDQNVGCNILLSNIYAAHGRWNDVAKVRRTVNDGGLRKDPGVSSIELNGTVHEFVMGDASHPQIREIHEMIGEMKRELKEAGHVADTSVVLLNVGEEEKESALCFHSEKLAIAFGLISTEPRAPLRVVKNLRVCGDCHAATKILSRIYGRIITVRDRNRYHRFAEGSCSCGDYCNSTG
ncbi:Pentatricopeptide repeat-containing protein [Platanthera zijinensis]|uniref:Pentatricopeptide repeat-containing protein n=1 Tax=Platanthera zijinensis TaxID=2320716 RepID=A0AAP0BWT5_9ASPA